MRLAAYFMIGLGFLAGSLVAVQTPENEVSWIVYLPALAFGAMGTILARTARHHESRQTDKLNLGIHKLVGSLDRIVQKIVLLDGEKDALKTNEVHDHIDRLFRADLEAFVEVRETMIHLYGLPAYATVMSEFASGERHLNRAWSASVDGYVDEVDSSISTARKQFEQARLELLRLRRPQTPELES